MTALWYFIKRKQSTSPPKNSLKSWQDSEGNFFLHEMGVELLSGGFTAERRTTKLTEEFRYLTSNTHASPLLILNS